MAVTATCPPNVVCCEEEVFCFDTFELLRHALCVVGEIDVVMLDIRWGVSPFGFSTVHILSPLA